MHFPLVNEALLGGVNELDGILNGENVLLLRVVDVVHRGRKGGRFTGPRGPRDQHQAPA